MGKIKESITFASQAKKIEKRYKDRDKNSQEMNGYLAEMEMLMKKQEVVRMKELAMQSLKNYQKPTNASKYETGGPLNLNPTGNYQDNRFLPIPNALPAVPNSHLYPNPFMSNPATTPVTPNVADGLKDGIYSPDRLPQLPIKPVVSGQVGDRTVSQVEPGVPGIQDKGTGNLYTPLAIGKGIEFAGKLAMLSDGYDKVKPQYNPNESRVESLMANRSIDSAALENNALSQQNVALANLTDVRSSNVKRALVQNVIQSTTRALQDTKLRENEMNNAYKADYANTLNNLGQQKVQANVFADQANAQSKSNYQQEVAGMLANVGNVGQKVTDYKTTVAQQELVTSMLSTKNFKAGSASAIQEKLRKGIPLEEGDFIQLYTSNGKSKDEAVADYNNLMAKLYNKG